uniref:very-long-chain 3-oxoacyl-CoA reductase 1-like n=1 Tax=Fragaria vesca subsp. vesca TaxID=101020 RepID=UPI0005C7EEDF|nr:PREDICTED: very-long-chain 3-oxoacyl-CoA reductase 1-like [Fragaria vesca subsp. vesca]
MELQEAFVVAASCLGLFSVCKALFKIVTWIWVMFLRPPKNLKDYGSWVIITGSTDGIGKALAFELASKGLNIVLVGRNPSKLEATSNEIREQFSDPKVETKSIVVDLAKATGGEIARIIEDGIKGLDVGILINNAGISYPYARYFHEVDQELMENMLKVNMEAPSWVTKAVLPGMLKKKKGAIVNIGSAASESPSMPLYALYAATKS